MSEYWKSTPKYWCKHCGTYVRDTKLERANHEATGKHQGALRRFLRDLHRGHEQELRQQDRAEREIERLNRIVAGSSSGSSGGGDAGPSTSRPIAAGTGASGGGGGGGGGGGNVTREQRQKQWEQLVELGIEVPAELRKEMAMAGEWSVTNTRVIDDDDDDDDTTKQGDGDGDGGGEGRRADAVATGVRKRSQREAEDEEAAAEEDAAVRGLFKKPRRWGRDSKQMAPEDDAELDALLSGTLPVVLPKKEEERKIKPDPVKKGLEEEEEEELPKIKKEEPGEGGEEEGRGLRDVAPTAGGDGDKGAPAVKTEKEDADPVPAVVFKKRKPKNIRQK